MMTLNEIIKTIPAEYYDKQIMLEGDFGVREMENMQGARDALIFKAKEENPVDKTIEALPNRAVALTAGELRSVLYHFNTVTMVRINGKKYYLQGTATKKDGSVDLQLQEIAE